MVITSKIDDNFKQEVEISQEKLIYDKDEIKI
jgi:hypothetical protein